MRRLRLFVALLALAAVRVMAADTALPVADDLPRLAAQARAQGMPLVLLVSLPDCRFCEHVRRQHLVPLAAGGAVVRQVDIDGAAPVTGFDGQRSTQRELVRALSVQVVPTVLFLDDAGHELAPRLTGTMLDDFYGAYLDDALQAARTRLR